MEGRTLTGARGAGGGAFIGSSKGLRTPVEPERFAAEYRHAYRPGRLLQIDTDPEHRAFILARIDRLTFEQLEAEIAAHFPENRRVKRSIINDWWHRNGKPG